MGRYSNLEPYLMWKYLGIKEDGYEPLELSVEKLRRGEKDIKLGRSVSLEEMNRREELGLPRNICPVMPPNGKTRKELEDRDFPLLEDD